MLELERQRAPFIVIDGTDGAGKKTQLDLLLKRLASEGVKTGVVDFPQYGTPSAHFVERYLNGQYGTLGEIGPKAASLFYALDRFEAKQDMNSDLQRGNVLVSNRYVTASMGHQAGKIEDPKERAAYLDWLEDLEYSVLGLPRPTLQLILCMPADISQQNVDKKAARGYTDKKRDLHEEDREHLAAAERAYRELAGRDETFTLIECAPDHCLRAIEDIHEEIWECVADHLNLKQSVSSGTLEATVAA
ncbi:MAG: thymidylate kinase [Candidatus Doudnabacteria bacterium]|nr:thymidylate kinase [Candidatus Doudnabacteria bacterium]MCA9387651.1 thymidylate kinase [Candidatus Andersenbacteria bacterium]